MKNVLLTDAAKILNIIRKKVRNTLRDNDPDLIHDIAMDAYERCLRWEGDIEHPYTFVQRVAYTTTLSYMRDQNNRERILRERGEDLIPRMSSDADDPADVYNALDTYKSLKYLGRASRDTAERLVRGETYQEIADANGITIGQVYNRVTKLRKDIAHGTEDRTTDSNYHARRHGSVSVDHPRRHSV